MSKVKEKKSKGDLTNDKEEVVVKTNDKKVKENETVSEETNQNKEIEDIEEIIDQKDDIANDKDIEEKEATIELEQSEENIVEETKCIETDSMIEQNEKEDEHQENEINVESEISETKKIDFLHKYSIAITVISILLFIGLVVFSTVFGLINRKSNKIVNGVYINKIEVSGLTYDEAKEKLTKEYQKKINQTIKLKHNEYCKEISLDEIEAKFGIDEALDIAYSIGRSGKLLKDNYAIINANLAKVNIQPSFACNEEKLTSIINETNENLPDKVLNSSYNIENNNLIITRGKLGYSVKKEELKNLILNNIINLITEEELIDIPIIEQEPDNIDIEKIHKEIYKEAKDAYYQKEPFTIYPHIVGVDFNISLEEAKSLVNNSGDTIVVPLKITNPNITTNQIGTEAFPDLLATYTTSFSASNFNRTTNIKLSSNKINGVVLMPGEEFSYNNVVGQRTIGKGYKSAPVYVGGKVVNDIGGGICQVSSTLYNTVLHANLEIVKRSNHRFATGYVPLSTDATVSWGGPEFIFKNSRKYPIKIVSTVTGGKIKVDIYGCKEEVEYDVIIQSETLQVIPMKTEYRTNTSLPVGTTKTVQKGHAGYKSRAYRILKLDGKVISKQLLSTDTYAQLSTIIEKN